MLPPAVQALQNIGGQCKRLFADAGYVVGGYLSVNQAVNVLP